MTYSTRCEVPKQARAEINAVAIDTTGKEVDRATYRIMCKFAFCHNAADLKGKSSSNKATSAARYYKHQMSREASQQHIEPHATWDSNNKCCLYAGTFVPNHLQNSILFVASPSQCTAPSHMSAVRTAIYRLSVCTSCFIDSVYLLAGSASSTSLHLFLLRQAPIDCPESICPRSLHSVTAVCQIWNSSISCKMTGIKFLPGHVHPAYEECLTSLSINFFNPTANCLQCVDN